MKTLFLIFFLLVSGYSLAQSYEVTYRRVFKLHPSPDMPPAMRLNFEKYMKNRFDVIKLWYVHGKSKSWTAGIYRDSTLLTDPFYYSGLGAGVAYIKDFGSGTLYLIPLDSTDNRIGRTELGWCGNWEMMPGDTVIGGFPCKKAKLHEIDLIAWYAESIPVMDGPLKYSGLPGLILGIDGATITYEAVNIQVVPNDDMKIEIPQSGHFVAPDDFSISIQQHLKRH